MKNHNYTNINILIKGIAEEGEDEYEYVRETFV
jgi:hypothetical protein